MALLKKEGTASLAKDLERACMEYDGMADDLEQ